MAKLSTAPTAGSATFPLCELRSAQPDAQLVTRPTRAPSPNGLEINHSFEGGAARLWDARLLPWRSSATTKANPPQGGDAKPRAFRRQPGYRKEECHVSEAPILTIS
jgi:hypothetical protein